MTELRRAFRMRLRPGAAARYRALHDAVDAVVLDELRRGTVRNYTIFRDGDDLFGYFELTDPEAFAQAVSTDRPALDWERQVVELLAEKRTDASGFPAALEEIFRLD
jgi:L-rhamnose mutarotase